MSYVDIRRSLCSLCAVKGYIADAGFSGGVHGARTSYDAPERVPVLVPFGGCHVSLDGVLSG